MATRAAILIAGGLFACGLSPASDDVPLWPEPPPDAFRVRPRFDDSDDPSKELELIGPAGRKLAPRVPLLRPEQASPRRPDRAWLLRRKAKAIPRPPTVAEQGGADIQYCPDYRPELYPERNLAQLSGHSLLFSPFLEQGDGRNPFRVAWDEVESMENSDQDLLIKSLLAGAYYLQHSGSPNALDGAMALLLAEESTGLANVVLNAVVPRAVDLLPGEVSGLPPPAEFGPGIDIRTESSASYNSVADMDTMLRTAAERGLGGIAVTDLDHVDGVREVRATAERLKAEGVLPADFIIIKGEQVQTLSGPVVALFVEDRVQRGMTIKATIKDIHRQGGVAVLADPGTGSGTKLVRTMDVDGYLLRSHPAGMFRTLQLMGEEGVGAKPLLAASGSRIAGAVGVPYSVAETQQRSAEGIRIAFRERSTYGATSVQMPLMAALLVRPLVRYQRTVASWFGARDRLEMAVAGLTGSDNVEIRTSYDEEISALLGLAQAPAVVDDIFEGTSPFRRTPRLTRISADYSYIRIGYHWDDHTVTLQGAIRW